MTNRPTPPNRRGPRRRTEHVDTVHQPPLTVRVGGDTFRIDFTAEIRRILEEEPADPAPVIPIRRNPA